MRPLRQVRIGPGWARVMNDRIFPGEPLDGADRYRSRWIGIKHTGGCDLVAFCGLRELSSSPGVWFLCRAGVLEAYRGKGLQKRMIRLRLRYAKAHRGKLAITYTTKENFASANSLISCGFRLYDPEWAWAGREMLYWQKDLK